MTHKGSSLYRGYALFLLPGVLAFLVLILFPFLANIGLSFTKWSGVGKPVWIGLANYERAISDSSFWASFKNNLLLIVAMTIIPTIVGLFLAAFLFDYIADKFGQGVASIFRAGFYLPQIIPLVVAGIVWRWIYQPQWGALNGLLRFLGLDSLARPWLGDHSTAMYAVMGMMVWFQIGYPLVIFMAALQRIDPELYEAAALDGASWLQKFFRITIHLIRPEIAVVVLTTAIHALKIFAPIYSMTRGGPGKATIVASYFSYQNFFERSNVGYGATIATILTLIIVLLTIGFILAQTRREE
ncbi:MAG: sugar ABC transporter permease [Anaerolineae bacterium]|nr:sugar ABC transporter permease [Anaerolineae bacterium]MDW8100466.1 sugar ABC transporter permease [Anaerolineae bacterium]